MGFKFVDKGIVNDDNMPEVDFYQMAAFGMRNSPAIDISEAKEKLGVINSGYVSWSSRPVLGTEFKILTSHNGEKYDELINNRYIKNSQKLNINLKIYMRYFVISEVATIFREQGPQLFNVVITLSNKLQEIWETKDKFQLEWKGGSD